jgi:hypothetical protein
MLLARPIAVNSVRQKDTGADDAKKCGDCFQHGKRSLRPSGCDLTARPATQSKGFQVGPVFQGLMMILCNSLLI